MDFIVLLAIARRALEDEIFRAAGRVFVEQRNGVTERKPLRLLATVEANTALPLPDKNEVRKGDAALTTLVRRSLIEPPNRQSVAILVALTVLSGSLGVLFPESL